MNAYRDQYAQLFRSGQNVVLIAISTDADTAQASWARDSQYPFLFLSDLDGAVGRAYGAAVAGRVTDNRNLFVVGPDGRIAYRAVPFREVDPTAYTDLGTALDHIAPRDTSAGH
jgi:thioredoxin-dependent peroxiredoxin